MDENKILTPIIKTTKDDQRMLLRYYAKQPWEVRVEIMEYRRKVFHMMKQKVGEISLSVIDDAALILATKATYVKEQKLKQLNFETMTLEEVQDLSLISMRQFEDTLPTQTPQRDKLISYWAIVKQFYTAGKSVNKLRLFLQKKKNFEISNTTILNTFLEIEQHKWSEKP